MTITNATSDSTTDHRQDDCRCPDDRCAGYHHEVGEPCPCGEALENESRDYAAELASSYTMVDGGTADLGTHVGQDNIERFLAHKVILDREKDTLTVVRNSGDQFAADYEVGEVSPPSADEWEQITETVARAVLDGSQRTEWFFTLGLEADRKTMQEQTVHPSGCEDSECMPALMRSEVEHKSPTEKLEAGQIEASAETYLITAYLDYRKDPKPFRNHCITLGGEGFFPTTGIVSGEPQELRALGEFIVAQADRFANFGVEVAAA